MKREKNPTPLGEEELATAARRTLVAATRLYELGVDWATFYRRILGSRGVVRELFSEIQHWEAFLETEAYTRIQEMMADLRQRAESNLKKRNSKHSKHRVHESNKMITIRLPASLHQTLMDEAEVLGTSMNQLCISKLVQLIEQKLVVSTRHDAKRNAPPGSHESGDKRWLESLEI